jgi:4-diphosphocytidyl-2-C-methyl-D-erythritol kinase
MFFKQECSIKINLTLRVLAKRWDGYHDIHSLFWRRKSPEFLELRRSEGEDRLSVDGMDIPGENLITCACRYIRTRYKESMLPPLDVRLVKCLPTGSGVGAGSGNAAALLRWFFSEREDKRRHEDDMHDVASIGADVAFLASGYDLAIANGIGEKLEGLDEPDGLDMPGVVFFPQWRNDTAEAFSSLDQNRDDGLSAEPLCAKEARAETFKVLRGLKMRERLGLLPNDFISCASLHSGRYGMLYDIIEKAGALAWGLCGSGSSCFALFDDKDGGDSISRLLAYMESERSSRFAWLNKTLVLE